MGAPQSCVEEPAMRAIAAAAALAAMLVQLDASAAPNRIVSLSPCVDTILVELVPLESIAALSHYSRDPERSTIAMLAQRLPVTYESAEEVVALKPDLVLMSRHSAVSTRNALQRVGIRYELFDVAYSVTESVEQIRRIAQLVGRDREGAALTAKIERAIATARPQSGARRVTAAVYQPGGLSAGVGTVTDDLMHVVGIENVAARHGVQTHQPLPLELLISSPPDVLLVADIEAGSAMHAARIAEHRALRVLDIPRHAYPARLMYCAGPTIVDALAALVAAREHAYAKAGSK
jgi:iron complex transport system substrate-binding protein